jgi:uncharacterized heparinase superfamily protein
MSSLTTSGTFRKLSRLSAMGPGELAHRFRERIFVELDRMNAGIRVPAPRCAVDMPFKTYLMGAPAHRFYPGQRENLRPFVEAKFPAWIDRAVEEAERLCRHEITLLGHPGVAIGAEINWHRDPITGRIWERHFWADYRPVHESGGRDSKSIHELNRHQHLPRLAKAYVLTGEERYAGEAVAQLNSWIDQNPPGLGINWQSSLEVGIRVISWLWTIFLLLHSRSLDDDSAERIGASLFAQLEHVHRYLSLFSSPNTHLIGEATALFLAGLVFQDQKQPDIWLRDAAVILAETAEKQVLEDGVYGELSSCYHCYALDFYLQALVLADQNEFALPEAFSPKVEGMLEFLLHLTRPDGTLPMLGDDDGGRALAFHGRDYHSFPEGLCLGALHYRRGDFKHQAGAFAEEALWMLGRKSVDDFEAVEAFPPAETTAHYPSAGYSIVRSGWGTRDSHVVFDRGGLGMLTGAHAHADALSIALFGGGRELLVDPGTFVYNCASEWRGYFRSTRAHNTVSVDDRDQSGQGGTFRWTTRYRCRAATSHRLPGLLYLEGEHDGYLRLSQGVIHRRRLLFVAPESWLIVDDLRGSGEHKVDVSFHFAPDLDVSSIERVEDGLKVRVEQEGFVLHLFADRPVQSAKLIRGESAPPGGWASRGYGQKQPCSVLRVTLAGLMPAVVLTCLVRSDGNAGHGPDGLVASQFKRARLEKGQGIACSRRHSGYEDVTVFSTGDREIEVADYRMRGEFFWLRREDGDVRQALAIRACSLEHGGREVFRRSEPGSYFYPN